MDAVFEFSSGLTIKEILGYLSIFAVALTTVPYVQHMRAGKIKPHIFTWVIWSLTTGIAAAARMTEQAGAGCLGAMGGGVQLCPDRHTGNTTWRKADNAQ